MKQYIIKFLLLFTALLLSVLSVSANVEVLNSCGKSSGWTSNTEYYLNFTTVPALTSTCFSYTITGGATLENITLRGNGDWIRPLNANFIFFNFGVNDGDPFSSYTNTWQNIYFKDIKLDSGLYFISRQNLGQLGDGKNYIFNNISFINSDIKNIDNLFYQQYTGSGSAGPPVHSLILSNLKIINTSINYNSHLIRNIRTGGSSETFTTTMSISVMVEDSFIYTKSTGLISLQGSTNICSSASFTNTILLAPPNNVYGGCYTFTSSLVEGYSHLDNNNDNIADIDDFAGMAGMNIVKKFKDTWFLQGATTSDKATLSAQGYAGNEELVVITHLFDYSIALPYDFSGFPNVILGMYGDTTDDVIDDNIDFSSINSLIASPNVKIQPASFLRSNDDVKITLTGNNLGDFTNNAYWKMKGTFEVSNLTFIDNRVSNDISGNVIGNFLFSNIIGRADITNNNFIMKTTTNRNYYSEVIDLNALIINVKNNTFRTTNESAFDSGIKEIMNVGSASARITENVFISPLTDYKAYICAFTCDFSIIWNNFIGTNFELSAIDNMETKLNNTVTYLKNNNIYYFNIGNYWEDNIACVDNNNDGICDSPYIVNGVTDYRPLVSYPYDFDSNLIYANIVVALDEFDITNVYPANSSTINISSSSATINIIFTQNSDFPDLTCYLYVDGNIINVIENPTKNTNIITPVTSWQTKQYEYFVTCSNVFVEQTTQTNTFNVNIVAGSGTIGDIDTETGFSDFITNKPILADNPNDTFSNIKELTALFLNPILNFIIIIGVVACMIALVWSLVWIMRLVVP